jgi:hypothetical protein
MFTPKKGAVIFKEYVAGLRIFLLQNWWIASTFRKNNSF